MNQQLFESIRKSLKAAEPKERLMMLTRRLTCTSSWVRLVQMKDDIRGPRENHNILIAVKLVYGRLRASLAIVLSSLGCRYLWKRWYVSFDMPP